MNHIQAHVRGHMRLIIERLKQIKCMRGHLWLVIMITATLNMTFTRGSCWLVSWSLLSRTKLIYLLVSRTNLVSCFTSLPTYPQPLGSRGTHHLGWAVSRVSWPSPPWWYRRAAWSPRAPTQALPALGSAWHAGSSPPLTCHGQLQVTFGW